MAEKKQTTKKIFSVYLNSHSKISCPFSCPFFFPFFVIFLSNVFSRNQKIDGFPLLPGGTSDCRSVGPSCFFAQVNLYFFEKLKLYKKFKKCSKINLYFLLFLTIKCHPNSEYWLKYFLYIKVYSINILIFIIKNINNELKKLKKFGKQ